MPSLLPLANVAVVRNDFETRQKFLELHLPVLEYTRWDNDEVRAPSGHMSALITLLCMAFNSPYPLFASQPSKQRDGLNSFPKVPIQDVTFSRD